MSNKKRYNNSEALIPVSEFKAKCLQLLGETNQTGREYTITKKGTPIAKVVPIKKKTMGSRRGSLKGMGEIHGDIVNVNLADEWEVFKP